MVLDVNELPIGYDSWSSNALLDWTEAISSWVDKKMFVPDHLLADAIIKADYKCGHLEILSLLA